MVYKTYKPQRRFGFRNKSFSVNTSLIIINLFLFVAFYILLVYNESFIDYIALKPANILAGRYIWTFLTSMFMHAGFWHIFANMFSLLFIGMLVEKIIGGKRYLWFYLISGLFAGLLFVLTALIFKTDLNTYAVGASGALFGLVGLLVVLTPNLPVYVMFIPIPIKMKYAGPGILIILWLISSLANVPIGNIAHLGGLIIGLIYGFYLRKKFRKKTEMIRRYFS